MNRCLKCRSHLLTLDPEGDLHCEWCGAQIMVSRPMDIPNDRENKRVFSGHPKAKLRGVKA